MKILKSGTPGVRKIVCKKDFSPEEMYQLSQYVLQTENHGSLRILHTMTGVLMQLDRAEAEQFRRLTQAEQNGSALAEAGMQQLAEESFFVKTSVDEYRQYQNCIQILKIMKKREKGIRQYVIFPTTSCNARCVYCFEEGFVTHTMTKETADQLVAFILKTRCSGSIKLKWFGGEPLAAAGIISRICQKLQENQVEYHSDIITNASLMTKEIRSGIITMQRCAEFSTCWMNRSQ